MATPTVKSIEKYRQELTCTICRNLFKDPKTLDCLHTYCSTCLPKLIAYSSASSTDLSDPSRGNSECSGDLTESDNFKPACDFGRCKLKQLKVLLKL